MTVELDKALALREKLERRPRVVCEKMKPGVGLALLGARPYEGGVLEGWQVTQSVERYFLFFRMPRHDAEKKPRGFTYWAYGIGGRTAVYARLADPPKLNGWTRVTATLGLDRDLFPETAFDAARAIYAQQVAVLEGEPQEGGPPVGIMNAGELPLTEAPLAALTVEAPATVAEFDGDRTREQIAGKSNAKARR